MKKLITATVALTTLAVPSVVGVKPLVDAGYNVLTWDARGFGGSGGRIMIDDQHFEGRDGRRSSPTSPASPRQGSTGAATRAWA